MEKPSLIVVLSLFAAGAAAAVVLNNVVSAPDAVTSSRSLSQSLSSSAAIDDRLIALEAAVEEERQARQYLEDELLVLYAEIEQLQSGGSADNRDLGQSDASAVRQTPVSTEAAQASGSRGARDGNLETERRAALIQAGMSPARADQVLRRESEVRFESMQALYEARSSGEDVDRFSMSTNPGALLREEIGDSDYEKYLLANNRPISVGVANVMAASPAERAGLQAGDEIVGYDGERVFSTTELMQRTMAGGDGDVVVDVIRDGTSMQVVLPRGPIGVETGRFRRR